ncbi:hypothetical protein Q4S45_15975 [Massilia sp. R2A-15]|uniref:Tse2 family ADP-ribosyltransferase toxin n=1 Tax=Massilia sp. R2A-15 TaxID=3064278 RepID=UPI00273230A4|nr:hypothetical protein [Massilia sp. R2A-15]WLI88223.1 hypothetical protein Q4S45_15975 [Massilia sp. R2A-15]
MDDWLTPTEVAPGVTTFAKSTVTWVRGIEDVNPADGRKFIGASEGVSLSYVAGNFGYALWFYFLLPDGTEIPAGLDVEQTGQDHTHYSIRCRNAMTKTAYEGALDNMARSAIARSIEPSRPALCFKE